VIQTFRRAMLPPSSGRSEWHSPNHFTSDDSVSTSWRWALLGLMTVI